MSESPHFFLVLAAVMFAVGTLGLTMRRNPLVMFMAIELMLNAANLAFLTFTRFPVNPAAAAGDGPAMVFVVMTVAAAEAVVGLAIIISIFRRRRDVDVDDLASLRG